LVRFLVRRSRHRIACSDLISVCQRRQNVSVPHTYRGSVAMVMAMAERAQLSSAA
jgi:hypothetical protein